MKTGNQVREAFLSFFEEKGHEVVASSSLVPNNDPTLLFVAAGMVQFKNVFLGQEKRPYTRATSSQRCVRAGGKHNDLENVGHTARHHTFFEMLGNFSFGDYFKEEAIPFAWELLTERLGLPAEKLLVTVYHTDDEAYNIWHKKIGLPAERIIKIATDDNFWTMGPDGPCGPCTEIFYDHGSEVAGGPPGSPDEDGDRFIEIWNIVFMQHFMQGGKIVADLEQKGVDTGSGLERLTAVCQGVHNNYDTDLFRPLITKGAALTGKTYGAHAEDDASLRVIADHLRSMSFMMIDGVMPSNEGRGYVLRRIMRRAMRHGNLLGMKEAFIYKMVATLAENMGTAYPELPRGQKMVEETIKLEEERFLRTLSQGLKLLEEEVKDLKKGSVLDGKVAFKLYDTYGFPIDLTADALRARGITVDEKGFETAMAEQRARARKAGFGSGQEKLSKVWFDLQDKIPAAEFLGYSTCHAQGKILALVNGEKEIKEAKKGEKIVILTNQTPFYAESGGQVADMGIIKTATGAASVKDVQKLFDGHLIQHIAEVFEGHITADQEADLAVDSALRQKIKANHSAAHLFHKALQEVLGSHVFQKGSLVNAEKMRFDFSHNKGMTEEEIQKVETLVNTQIIKNTEVSTQLMDQKTALEAGAMALFGEKYGDEVRVLKMGEGIEKEVYSVELCGGTHVSRTGDIGAFKIVVETSISAGVRRVEALTGLAALEYMRGQEKTLKEAAHTLKVGPAELEGRLQNLLEETKALKKELKEAKKNATGGHNQAEILFKSAEEFAKGRFVGAALEGVEAADLRGLVDDLKNRLGTGVVLLGSHSEGKVSLCAGVTKDLLKDYQAGKLVNIAAEKVGGKGGGRPEIAMAGGKDVHHLNEAIAAVKAALV